MKFHRLIFLLVFPVALVVGLDKPSFLEEQLRYPRVRNAYADKGAEIRKKLQRNGISGNEPFQLLLIAFKEEKELEVWIRNSGEGRFNKFGSYEICRSSGVPGPKRKEGDGQVPEGYYYINRFHPASDFHLSLGIDYPNKSDKIRCKSGSPGGDIFIHGKCVTIGCIPIQDEGIKELYIFCLEAKNRGFSKIPVWSFPYRFSGETPEKDLENQVNGAFWKEIRPGYLQFLKSGLLPEVQISADGRYVFSTGE
jgi:murein L,D-transpeptidase YafK